MFDIIDLLKKDTERMRVLEIVNSLKLPDCYVAVGFLRNMVWDYLHEKTTPINDIDVVFYDSKDTNNTRAREAESFLNGRHPEFIWEVRNQALMHLRNKDRPYKNTLDAMSYWPEKETAIAALINDEGKVSISSAFDLESLKRGKVTHNSKRSIEIFKDRLSSKQWTKIWPNLQVVM